MHFNKEEKMNEYKEKFHDYFRKLEKKYDFCDEETKKKIRQGVVLGALGLIIMLIGMIAKMMWIKTHYTRVR